MGLCRADMSIAISQAKKTRRLLLSSIRSNSGLDARTEDTGTMGDTAAPGEVEVDTTRKDMTLPALVNVSSLTMHDRTMA